MDPYVPKYIINYIILADINLKRLKIIIQDNIILS